jgi:hypothetical protein
MRGKVDMVTTLRHPRVGRLIRRLVLGVLPRRISARVALIFPTAK